MSDQQRQAGSKEKSSHFRERAKRAMEGREKIGKEKKIHYNIAPGVRGGGDLTD